MPLGTMLTDLLHELLNKCPNPTGNQEFIFCHDPCGPASREILRGISKAGGEQNKPCIGRRRANLATGCDAAGNRRALSGARLDGQPTTDAIHPFEHVSQPLSLSSSLVETTPAVADRER